jgi:hypothetical protein
LALVFPPCQLYLGTIKHQVIGVRRLKMMVRFFVRSFFGAALILWGQVANAQIAGQSPALQAPAIATFQANPGQLVSQFPNGGADLAKQVRDLVSSDKATLAAIIALAKTANNDQRKAIADGLAQVAKSYASSGDPASANQIQQAVVTSGLPEFAKAYAEAAGDSGTAAAGGGGGAGGGGSGGGPVAGPPTGGPNAGSVASGNSSSVNSGSGSTGIGAIGSPAFNQVSLF